MYTSYQKYKRIIVFIVAIWSCLLFSTVAFAQVDQTKFETSRIMNVRTITSTKSELEVGWDHLEGASVYEVWKLNPVTNGYDMIDETTTESYKISGLSQGVKISILIRAYYEYNGKKIYSAYSDMLPTGTVPNDVGNIQVVSTDSALIALTWEPSSSSSSYIIYRANEGSEEFVQIANVNATSYSDMKVSPASGYTYKIVAYITDTNIQSENATSIRTATTPIGTVITQSKGGSERARLRWSKIFAKYVSWPKLGNPCCFLHIGAYTHTILFNG